VEVCGRYPTTTLPENRYDKVRAIKMIPKNADYEVKGYRRGQLLVHTWHIGESSKDLEVSVWYERYKRGECTSVEVIDRNKFKITTYPPFPKT
jgi:hypothetical protein